MRTARPSWLTIVTVLSSLVAGSSAGLAETAKQPAKAPVDTPYSGGPPPVTDGYTDTSQGGTKTSGDAPIPPPSKGGQVESLQGTPESGSTSPSGGPASSKKPDAGG